MSITYLLPPPSGYGFNLACNSRLKTALRKIANVTNDTTTVKGSATSWQPDKNQKPQIDYSTIPAVPQPKPVAISTPKPVQPSAGGQVRQQPVAPPSTNPNRVKPLTRDGLRDEITRKNQQNGQQNSQQRLYGFFNRLSDIWYMLVDRIKMWWYSTKLKNGALTQDEFSSMQNSVKRLSGNRTARELGKWWNADKYNDSYFDYLPKFVGATPKMQELRRLHGLYSNDKSWGNRKKLFRYMRDNHMEITPAMQWGYNNGYINKDQWESYNKGLADYHTANRWIPKIFL